MGQAQDLFKCIAEGDLERARGILLEVPAAASCTNESGLSALLFALYGGQPDIAKLIRSAKAPDLFEASALGEEAAVSTLLGKPGSDVNGFSADGFTPLHLACFFGHPGTAEILLAAKADVNAISRNGAELKPINCASACRDPGSALRVVEMLLKRGADVGAAQKGGFSPLHSAAANGNWALAGLLLKHGANREAKCADGKTALDIARERNRAEVAALLS